MHIIAYIISVAVPAFAIYLVFALDLFGTGKGNTVFICLVWGATGAFGASYFLNTFIVHQFNVEFNFLSTRVAPIVEEVLKAAILVYFIQQPRFRYFIDGAIYGFAAGIGFAMTENIFYVANDASGAAISLSLSRVLSASLMHATASAVVGISFGLSRRMGGVQKMIIPLAGVVFGIVVHFIYNNLLIELGSGAALLLTAIGIGLGGGIMIAVFITQGLEREKRRFEESLGVGSGVSAAERKAVQKLGSESIEDILDDMAVMFGPEKAELIRQLLVKQANMGILKNNLKSPVGERLKKAWEAEVVVLRSEIDQIRKNLGAYTMTLLRSLLPEDEDAMWDEFNQSVAEFDPLHVHSYDLFMVASKLAETIPPEKIEETANRLHQISIFKNVELSDLDNLARAITMRSYSHGEMLFDKGDTGDAMYLIDRGYIDIFTVDADGKQELLRTYEAGNVVGELALLDGQPRSARARANGPLRVMILQRKHFNMFIQSRPKVILAVLQFLADRVRYTTDAVTADPIEETAKHLQKISIFENIELSELYNLAREITMRRYAHGEILFDKGDSGDAMYLIDNGYIDIFRVIADGKQEFLRTCEAGEAIGELALLDGQPRSARARANGPARVMVLQREHFNKFIQSRPKVILAVLQFLADRVRYVTDAVTADPIRHVIHGNTNFDDEDTSLDISPITTPTTQRADLTQVGIFGRINQALNAIESQSSQEEEK